MDKTRRSMLGLRTKNPEMKVEEAPSPKLPAVQSRSKEVDKFLDEAKSKPKQEINRREAVRGGIAAITNASRIAQFAFRNDTPKNPFDSAEFAKNPPVPKRSEVKKAIEGYHHLVTHDEVDWDSAHNAINDHLKKIGIDPDKLPDTVYSRVRHLERNYLGEKHNFPGRHERFAEPHRSDYHDHEQDEFTADMKMYNKNG